MPSTVLLCNRSKPGKYILISLGHRWTASCDTRAAVFVDWLTCKILSISLPPRSFSLISSHAAEAERELCDYAVVGTSGNRASNSMHAGMLKGSKV